MGDVMPKEQADYIHNVKLYCLNATNMTEQEAYTFAFRCWQLGFVKKKHIVKEIFEEIEALSGEDVHGNLVIRFADFAELKKEYIYGKRGCK